jgi:hypothetical protein
MKYIFWGGGGRCYESLFVTENEFISSYVCETVMSRADRIIKMLLCMPWVYILEEERADNKSFHPEQYMSIALFNGAFFNLQSSILGYIL